MRTEASSGQSTQSTQPTATSADPSAEAVAIPTQSANGAEQAATLDAAIAEEVPPTQPSPLASPPPARTPFVRRRRVTWLSTVMQGLSLDERLGRIILSIVLASLLWFYVTSLENPAQVTQFNGLTVEVRGLGPNLKLIQPVPGVNVTVQAPQNIMSTLQQGEVRPYVDLQQLDAGVHEVPVAIDVSGLAERNSINFSVTPRTVQVQLEVEATRTFSVSVRVTGTPPIGYGADPPQLDPGQVSITGSQAAINRISQLVVTVDVNDSTATQRGYKTPVALDSSGQEITGLTFTPSTLQVIVPIKPLLAYKQVSVRVPVVGNPAPGYSALAIDLDPTTVTICCAATDVLSTVTSLDTQPVSISGTTTTVITTTQLVLPAGIQLYPGQSTAISVTVQIDTFQTSWQLAVAPTIENVAPGLTASSSPNSLDLTLAGTLAQFQNLKPSDVQASIDASGLAPGIYQVSPTITVPQGIKVVAVNPAQVSLSLVTPTPVPPTVTAIPTSAPTATANILVPPTSTSLTSPTFTGVPVPTATPTAQPTLQPAISPSPALTPSPTELPSSTPTTTPTITPGTSVQELKTPAPLPTSTPTSTPTRTSGAATSTPSIPSP